ncbi:hypothetical protein B566_EDAN004174 [Ephemera danica]|nr:hypothetical protein B566_EDAN004174 [Ephemera danica]
MRDLLSTYKSTGGTSTARPASLARGGAVLSTSDVTLVAGASTATVSSSMKKLKKENEFPIVHVHMTAEDTEVTEVKNEGRSNDLTSGGFLQFIPSGIRRMFRALFSFDRRNFNLFNIFVNSNLHTA